MEGLLSTRFFQTFSVQALKVLPSHGTNGTYRILSKKGTAAMNANSVSSILLNLLKTGLAGGLIVLIAWSVGVFDLDGDVQESHADIFDLRFSARANPVEEFAKTLQDLGHPEPRTYAINNNRIYFSVRHTNETPGQILNTYQQRFAANGLNDRVYTTIDEAEGEARMITALTGGIVPHSVDPEHVTMGGMITRGRAQNAEELRRDYLQSPSPSSLFRGHRWIEAFRSPDHNQTTVIASWSDESFMYGRMHPDKLRVGYGAGADHMIPSCPGCVRLNRLEDLTDESSFIFESNIYMTSHSPAQIVEFYDKALASRGWEALPQNDAFYELQTNVDFEGRQVDIHVFTREDRLTKLVIYSHGGSTYVHTSMQTNDSLN
ncbi:hypothetical protein FRC98_16330 [Lujinxingia vulgaris]|uniref:Uncharacterized protein n=1 Tax=Lujinxingia vulgaris TaxID=2600176 RepID=A0A5C6X0V8_9DELT|nr:hypothetical protein [Lujinxingia vulgaris]TXD35382.1 hypothetical protein FRC98_16330 [Lujinxingia vulgaris]